MKREIGSVITYLLTSFAGGGAAAFLIMRYVLIPRYEITPGDKFDIFSTLVLILLGILALGGYVLYRDVRGRVEARALDFAQKAAHETYATAMIRSYSHTAALWGRTYEALLWVVPPHQESWIKPFIGHAVFYGELAVEETKLLPPERLAAEENTIIGATNVYAMALAIAGDTGTAKRAADLVKYLESRLNKIPEEQRPGIRETLGFVRWRLPRKQSDTLYAATILRGLLRDPDIALEDKARWKWRWKKFPKGTV